ncbi:ATP-binding cassette domain-containing protein [Persicimonas caeni]|uniref:ATP-binding cassette domain-containing protein n=1 Tax=Persicimonas caeni TaxID=2292766 RepID=A0A4Y6PV24_PERCE|nr:ATP-binding cassette domain-containing protein [Persicimonas caeni]QDG51847.1 ATP-binding cassette domain-containing protein [Persicimonas caeni]QED33068.1 ATP-binding cassette domain-containing protein [Persicimonas caeni]
MSEQKTSEPVIECRDLVCGYGDVAVLEDVNVEIFRGEIAALLGGSGSGKSTLLKTIVGLLPPLSGEIRLLGEDIYAMTPKERSRVLRRTGMLYQYGALFGSRTIYDNISLPLRQHTNLPEPVIREMVRQKLALVGLEGLEFRLPADVSGGQRKRVALARATIMDPEIVFADEPSAGLDPVVAAGLDALLRQMQRLFGVTMVVVTHELESIKILADRVVMLADGRVRAVGTVEELSNSDDEIVYNFFHRVPPDYVDAGDGGSSVLDAMADSQS